MISMISASRQAREAGDEERSLSLEPALVFGEQSAGGYQGAEGKTMGDHHWETGQSWPLGLWVAGRCNV